MNFRRCGPALLLLAWTQLALTDERQPAQPRQEGQPVQAKQPAKDQPKKAEPIQIPYRLTNTQHILVRVKIDGKGPFNFIVDTGAPIMILANEPAKKLGLDVPAKEKGKDKGKAKKADGFVKFDRVEIEGGAVLEKFPCLIVTPFQIKGMNAMGMAGRELHGILGYTVLAKFRMEIDLTKDKMLWTPLDYTPPAPIGSGGGEDVGLEAIGKIYEVLGMFMGIKNLPPVPRGFVGIQLQEEKKTVSISAVLGKSPADAAGLKVGDEIVEVNGKAVKNVHDVLHLTAEATVGRPIELVVRRGGEKLNIRLETGDGL